MKKLLSLIAFSSAFVFNYIAQCPSGQVNVTVDVITDNWGYECFWDITPTGNGCGNGALFSFGNTAEMNCASGGAATASAGGYADNSTTTETIGCLALNSCFDINYVDDFGDGGAIFVVKFNGVITHVFSSIDTTITATYTFCVSNPPIYDASISTQGFKYSKLPLSQSLNFVKPAQIFSAGTGTITNVNANAKIFKGGVEISSLNSGPQTIASLTSSSFIFSQYTATSFGVHTLKYSSNIAEVDEVSANDSASFEVDISDTVFAIDDNNTFGLIGLDAGEKGYLGNLFEITKATKAKSVSLYLGDGTQNNGVSVVDSVFKVHIFSTNPLGVPQSIIATTTGQIENVLEKWYTISFAAPINLAVGQYMVAIEEEHYVQELGFSLVHHPMTSYVSSASLIPWSPVEDFNFPVSFMIRLNLETSGLSVLELANSELKVYPNPAHEELSIENTVKGARLEIYNELGQLVHSSETQLGKTNVRIDYLKNGLYTLKTIEENKIGLATFLKD